MRVIVASLAVGMWLATGVASAQDAKVAAGQKVYDAQKCSMCHAVAGKGNAKNPLDGVGAKLSDAQIKEWIVTFLVEKVVEMTGVKPVTSSLRTRRSPN